MATFIVGGQTKWSMTRDESGYRTYKITFRVRGTSRDGPLNVLTTPGLPLVGAPWGFGLDADYYVWCRFDAEVNPVVTEEPNKDWLVTHTFSNKPAGWRCNDTPTADPIFEPQKVSGSFVKYTEEATYDRFGAAILTSAGEPIRGPQVEFDKNRPCVEIEQNVLDLQLGTVAAMVDTVNDSPLWGLPARCIKLSDFSWDRKYQGSCYAYYTRKFKFDVRYETFDRTVLDEGTMVLRGTWDKDPKSTTFRSYRISSFVLATPHIQSDYVRYKDWNEENATVILDGHGRPWDANHYSTGTGDDTAGQVSIQKYSESNFLLLGIPLIL